MSLERLLSSVEQEGISMATEGVQATASELRYRKQLKAASRKIQHLTEVLHESEESTVRFSDQAKLLKEEIRRCIYTIYTSLDLLHLHMVSIPFKGWNGTSRESRECQVWNTSKMLS